MLFGKHRRSQRVRDLLRVILSGPQLLAFMPAITLAAFWLGGEVALIVIAFFMPCAFAIAGLYSRPADRASDDYDPITDLPLRREVVSAASKRVDGDIARRAATSAVAVAIDDFSGIVDRLGTRGGTAVLKACTERLRDLTSEGEFAFDRGCFGRLDGPRFLAVVTTSGRADLESLIQFATRIQRRMQDPVQIDNTNHYVSVSVGFCIPSRNPGKTVEDLVGAAEHALDDAVATGSGVVRAFTNEMQRRARSRFALAEDLAAALDTGQIKPFFQPQVDTVTLNVTGFEVLARWEHPENGLVPPGDFLPAAEELGLLERLGEVILNQSLTALRTWDANGLGIPNLSINFSAEELRNPHLVDRIRWEVDRFDIAPERLTVEVLETVIAQSANDTIIRNLRSLSEFGFGIDLDDFGTGHASIANIKRFSVARIKIDRSFVTRIHEDHEQQNIVAAILTLADRLDLQAIGEGVETEEELAVLRQLGCSTIQGYAIARPMPFDRVEPWMRKHAAALDVPPPAAEPGRQERAARSGGKTA